MAICEWPAGCTQASTHTDTITFPETPDQTEVWEVCRQHDKDLKLQAVRSRPEAKPQPATQPTFGVRCGGCKRELEEPTDLPPERRQPCASCGSVIRDMSVSINATISFHDSLEARVTPGGRGKWMVKVQSGDDYTHDLAAWGKLGRTVDRTNDTYREVIELYDGTKFESVARLSDHEN